MKAMEGMTFDPRPLRRAFLLKGLGYGKLAVLSGCSDRTVSAVINGHTPGSKFARKVAEHLDVDLNDCWTFSDHHKGPQNETELEHGA